MKGNRYYLFFSSVSLPSRLPCRCVLILWILPFFSPRGVDDPHIQRRVIYKTRQRNYGLIRKWSYRNRFHSEVLFLYPLIRAYAYRRTIITFSGCDKNIKNQLKFKTNSKFVFYVRLQVRICIPVGLQLFEQQQYQLLKYFSVCNIYTVAYYLQFWH